MFAGYSLDQVRKAVIAALVAGLAVLAFFIQFDPGFDQAAVAVTVGVFNVIGVFLAKNHTAEDAQKAVEALTASTLGLVGFFVTVNPSDAETAVAAAVALVNVLGVFLTRND